MAVRANSYKVTPAAVWRGLVLHVLWLHALLGRSAGIDINVNATTLCSNPVQIKQQMSEPFTGFETNPAIYGIHELWHGILGASSKLDYQPFALSAAVRQIIIYDLLYLRVACPPVGAVCVYLAMRTLRPFTTSSSPECLCPSPSFVPLHYIQTRSLDHFLTDFRKISSVERGWREMRGGL